jgi:HAD superfamily hydrolase (TIGR01509 family)
MEKEKQYQDQFRPHLTLIDGLEAFLQRAHHSGIRMAIGSAAILYNIDFVLDGLSIRQYMQAIVSAEDVEVSKPNPETFLRCAKLLEAAPANCLVFEDTPKGAEAAANAGMDCLVITTLHRPEEFSSLTNIIAFISDYNDPVLQQLL